MLVHRRFRCRRLHRHQHHHINKSDGWHYLGDSGTHRKDAASEITNSVSLSAVRRMSLRPRNVAVSAQQSQWETQTHTKYTLDKTHGHRLRDTLTWIHTRTSAQHHHHNHDQRSHSPDSLDFWFMNIHTRTIRLHIYLRSNMQERGTGIESCMSLAASAHLPTLNVND